MEKDRLQAAVKQINGFCKSASSLSRTELDLLSVQIEIAKEVLDCAASELVHNCKGLPLLNSRSADGTPIATRFHAFHKLPNGRRVQRSGRASHEFLVKNQFVRGYDRHGTCLTAVKIQDPLRLEFGKSCIAIFVACVRDWLSLRQMGHNDISIEHFAFDRFGIGAHERLWCLHAAVYIYI